MMEPGKRAWKKHLGKLIIRRKNMYKMARKSRRLNRRGE